MTSQPDPAKSAGDATAAVNCAVEGRRIGEVSVVSVSGTVDMLTAPWLEEAIGAAVKGSPSAVVVDMSAVDFLASAGMGVLVAARNDLDPGRPVRRGRRRARDEPAAQADRHHRCGRPVRDPRRGAVGGHDIAVT